MIEMYSSFKNSPSQVGLDIIILRANEMVSEASTDMKGTGFTTSIASSFSNYWLRIDDAPTLTNRHIINNCFNEILADVNKMTTISISEDARAIYLNIIREYAEKIKRVYQL